MIYLKTSFFACLLSNWKEALTNRKFSAAFSISLIILAASLILLTSFLSYVEQRSGVILNDPLLNLINPVNLTWFIFALIYLSLALALLSFITSPRLFLFAIQSYALLVLTRIAAMYFLPLEPPVKMIPLADPFVQFFGPSNLLTKDLFFSGHTATIFLFFLIAKKGKLKIFFFANTCLVALSVIIQNVHYSIDVFSAPFFTFCCYTVIKSVDKILFGIELHKGPLNDKGINIP
jgi:hypothetical protein